jgi:Ca2+-binding RTX toxin-like protein
MARRTRRRTSRRRQGLFWLALAAAVAFGFVTTQAFTASNTVPTTNIGQFTQVITPVQLEPAECISGGVTATSIVSGTGTVNGTAANQLILGSNAVDTITDTFNTGCLVGGAGSDSFQGKNGGGDLCIVSTATVGANVKKCTIVATRP